MNILDLIRNDGFKPKYVGKTHGFAEYASPCPWCGGDDRFRIWPDKEETGRYWCRQCKRNGRGISYLMEYHGLSYLEACERLNVKPDYRDRPVSSDRRSHSKDKFVPKDFSSSLPCLVWQKKAKAFIEKAEKNLWNNEGAKALSYLKNRGLTEKTIKEARLGYNPVLYLEKRKEWGLDGDGSIYLSKGITIPYFAEKGKKIKRVRFRLDEPYKGNKYIYLAGGVSQPMIWHNKHIASVIVESELCGWLLHQEAGDLVNIIAIGHIPNKPDVIADKLIRKSELVLVCLDMDIDENGDPGPGLKEMEFYRQRYKNIQRLVNPKGKDPTELHQAGIPLRTWLESGFPWPGEFQETYEERAAIMEYEGRLLREKAESKAFSITMEIYESYQINLNNDD